MTLAALIAADVDDVFLVGDDFAESISYTPAGGSARTILAVITVIPAEIVQEGEHKTQHEMIQVFAKKHATEGILTPAEGDTVAWNSRTYCFVGRMQEDSGGFTLKFSAPQLLSTGLGRGFGF